MHHLDSMQASRLLALIAGSRSSLHSEGNQLSLLARGAYIINRSTIVYVVGTFYEDRAASLSQGMHILRNP